MAGITPTLFAGAGEESLDADGAELPSGPFTDTLGISLFVGVVPVGEVALSFRAPGGMYAFVPRITAPYLKNSENGALMEDRDRTFVPHLCLYHRRSYFSPQQRAGCWLWTVKDSVKS
jgi:hypothetical protein